MELNTNMTVDLEKVKELVYSDEFARFLLQNTTDFAVAAFVLQTLDDKIQEIDEEVE